MFIKDRTIWGSMVCRDLWLEEKLPGLEEDDDDDDFMQPPTRHPVTNNNQRRTTNVVVNARRDGKLQKKNAPRTDPPMKVYCCD